MTRIIFNLQINVRQVYLAILNLTAHWLYTPKLVQKSLVCLSVGCPYFHPFRTRSLGCILLASDSMPVDDATWICVYQKRFISFKTPSCGRPRRAYTRYRKLEVYLGNPFRAHAIFSNSSPDRVEAFPLLVPILQVIICTIEISLIHTQLYFIFSPNLLGLGLTVISPSLFALH